VARNLKLTLSYDGSDFSGWQTQPGVRTVQETLESAIRQLTGAMDVRVSASGRTDAGVHALGQVVNFRSDTELPAETLVRALNAHLPEDIVVRDAVDVPASFDANRDALGKLYRYVIHDGATVNPFMRRYACHSRYPLDTVAMREAAQALTGRHDFSSFETAGSERATSVRTIGHLSVNRFGEWIWIDVEGSGFLYNMVRAIAGTLMNIGRGYWPVGQARTILEATDRTLAGPTAPAHGLFLVRVQYQE
jgi:tRNA pseudouridine38-40 synthase